MGSLTEIIEFGRENNGGRGRCFGGEEVTMGVNKLIVSPAMGLSSGQLTYEPEIWTLSQGSCHSRAGVGVNEISEESAWCDAPQEHQGVPSTPLWPLTKTQQYSPFSCPTS